MPFKTDRGERGIRVSVTVMLMYFNGIIDLYW